MVSPSKPSSRLAANPQKTNQTYKPKRGSKPLENLKFYLDIEKNNVLAVVEKQITELGGTIEFFFGKNVTHFITDKDNNNISSVSASSPQLPSTPKTPLTPITPLLGNDRHLNASSPSISSINDFKPKQHAPRSRTEAMLQISRLQSTANNSPSSKQSQLKQASPIQAAKTLGIQIWSVDYAIKEFEALLKQVTNQHHSHRHTKRSPSTKSLKGDYIKIEAASRQYRPVYQEFKRWPRLNLLCKLTYSPFDNAVSNVKGDGPVNTAAVPQQPAADNNRMTRKTSRQVGNTANNTNNKTTQATATNAKQCGYCELCRIEYDVLAVHLESDEHLNFVKNETNFSTLDNLINSSGANIESFLKLNSELVVSVSVEQFQSEIGQKEKVQNSNQTVDKGEKLTDRVLEKQDKTIKNKDKVVEIVEQVDNTNDPNLTQMFGRRSAIHQYPHHTLNQLHKHHKLKQVKQQEKQNSEKEDNPAEKSGDDMRNSLQNSKSNSKNNDKQRSPKEDMGLKNSTAVKNEGTFSDLDLQDTKRISLGLRQKPPKRINQETNSLIDDHHHHIQLQNHQNEDSAARRMRRETCKRINYSEPKEDENLIDDDEEDVTEKSLDIKVRGIRWRAPSPEARPPLKSPLLYKVIEDKNEKTAKSATTKSEKAPVTAAAKNGLTLKIKRVRQSELNLLNNEAENFMFPKKDDDSDTDDDRHTSSEGGPEISVEIISSEPEKHPVAKLKDDHFDSEDDLTLKGKRRGKKRVLTPDPLALDDFEPKKMKEDDAQGETDRAKRHNKRLQHFLQDNEEYYKFEDPGSRLRFPEAPIQPESTIVTAEPLPMSPNKGSVSQKSSVAPTKRSVSPEKSSVPPAKSNVSPTKSSVSPAKGKVSLEKSNASPATSNASPSKSNASLEKKSVSPSRRSVSPIQSGSPIQSNVSPVKSSMKEDGMGVYRWATFMKKCKEIEPYRFAFERLPDMETWYEAFNRQDMENQKVYEYFGNTAYRKLPFEVGRIPPLKSNCCILNYNIKGASSASSCVSAASTSTTSCSTSTLTMVKPGPKKPGRKPGRKKSTISDETLPNDEKQQKDGNEKKISLPLKKRALLLEVDRPRKSPREHASTLAILSSLLQKRASILGNLSPTKREKEEKIVVMEQVDEKKDEKVDMEMEMEIEMEKAVNDIKEEEMDTVSNHSGGNHSEHEEEQMDKIKFTPPIHKEDNFIDYNAMCRDVEQFFSSNISDASEDHLFGIPHEDEEDLVHMSSKDQIKRDFSEIVRTCDDEPPLTLRQVNRGEMLIRKNVQHDRKPRSMLQGGANCLYKPNIHRVYGAAARGRRQNRTGWPNVKRKIVTRKSTGAIKATPDEKHEPDKKTTSDEVEEEEFDELMLEGDDEIKTDDVTEDESDEDIEVELTPVRNTPRTRLPSSRYVTKTTNTMTRVDYNHGANDTEGTSSLVAEKRPMSRRSRASFVMTNDECDSISSRSIFVSDDCDTTSSTLITAYDDQPPPPPSETTKLNNSKSKNSVSKRLNFSSSTTATSNAKSNVMQPVVCIEKLNYSKMNTRSKSKSPNKKRSTANSLAAEANNSSPNKYSPRKLRKPRGRWYRER